MLGFVDDTSNFDTVLKKIHQNSPELCKLHQYASQSSEYLLSSSVGKLNPCKCVFYII